ncbi:hypothetical protein AN416_34020 (plasmid) [Paraburkholderia caribensis]|nr:hypothetical protein AN416_34020 [Paraburkholderia caribensis]
MHDVPAIISVGRNAKVSKDYPLRTSFGFGQCNGAVGKRPSGKGSVRRESGDASPGAFSF